MSVLEWIFVLEAVLLVTAGMFWVAGLAIGRDNPDERHEKGNREKLFCHVPAP